MWLHDELTDFTATNIEGAENRASLEKPDYRSSLTEYLETWRSNHWFSGIRDPQRLAELPAPEREQCEKLWADVASALDVIARAAADSE
jgi:hypothetical protein